MNPFNTILLQPTDVLFFRDGRPMQGSLAGHGAAWPLPNVTDAAIHAALHRSGLSGHTHDQRHHTERMGKDNRRFGSLVTAGPFPVCHQPGVDTWYFPRPLDVMDDTLSPSLLPTAMFESTRSSLPDPVEFAIANLLPPSKESRAKAWLSGPAYADYLAGSGRRTNASEALDDSTFSDTEATLGIAIDPETGTTGQGAASGMIYSARYLRLRDQWRLGVFAKTEEKQGQDEDPVDLIRELMQQPQQILVGGQQRLCTATRCEANSLPLPRGKSDGFACHRQDGRDRWLVKWILLSPAIWPEIRAESKDGRSMTPHCGGWLPNWVRQEDGQVMLRCGERRRRSYTGKHTRGFGDDSGAIAAKCVAALVPKPMAVTGWALTNGADRDQEGAKSAHLAVAAGAVYYFEAETAEDATKLAGALNWHGNTPCLVIKNRRSTLLGEKGFGLGVCGTWDFYEDVAGRLAK